MSFRSLKKAFKRSSSGYVQSGASDDIESSASPSTPSPPISSSSMRPIRTFPIDSSDTDLPAMRDLLDKMLGKDKYDMKQHLDRYILFAHRDLEPKELMQLTNPFSRDVSFPTISKESIDWLKDLRKLTTILAPVPKDIKTIKPVKIALIYTGSLPDQNDVQQFKQPQDFVRFINAKDSPTSTGLWADAVTFILEVFDQVQLYLANVPQGPMSSSETSAAIAKAIKRATEDLEADIIAIPFGVRDSSADLTNAVMSATRIALIFASASLNNDGNNHAIPYPARLRDVFCMFSTDGNGIASSFNPPPRPSACNFAILGERVILVPQTKPVSGTFISTVIAAGLAAVLLDFARQPDISQFIGEERLLHMKSTKGMMKVFSLMSRNNRDDGYDCLVPWTLLPRETHNRETTRRYIAERISMAL